MNENLLDRFKDVTSKKGSEKLIQDPEISSEPKKSNELSSIINNINPDVKIEPISPTEEEIDEVIEENVGDHGCYDDEEPEELNDIRARTMLLTIHSHYRTKHRQDRAYAKFIAKIEGALNFLPKGGE